MFRWPNQCLYGDWVAGLVVLVFGGHGLGCGLLVCWWFGVWWGFFFFSLFCWWFLPWWGVCDDGVVVVATLLRCVVVVVATSLGMCGYGYG